MLPINRLRLAARSQPDVKGMPMTSGCAVQQGDDMNRIAPLLHSIAVLAGCASHSRLGSQVAGLDSERSPGRSLATALFCNDSRPQ